MSRDATLDELAAMQTRALKDGILRAEPVLISGGAKRRLMPQNICRHDPCYCGMAPRHGFDPYDAEKAAQWLKDRAEARSFTPPSPPKQKQKNEKRRTRNG